MGKSGADLAAFVLDISDHEDVHVRVMRLLAALGRKRLVVVDGGEVGHHTRLVISQRRVRQSALVLTPPLDPVVGEPLAVDLLELRHHLGTCAMDDNEIFLVAIAAAIRAARPILLPPGRIGGRILDRAVGHPTLHPALLACVLALRAV